MGFLSSLTKIVSSPVTALAGGVLGAGLSYKASKDASNDAKDINRDTLDAQQAIYQQQREDYLPFYNVGKAAIPEYMRMLGIDEKGNRITTPASRELSPLALWQQQEFLKSQNRQDAARGLAGSGGASARIAEGNSAIAANDYQAQYQRILDALKLGTNASGSMGNSAAQYSSQIGQNGANQMNLTLGQGETKSQLWQGIGSLPMDYLSLSALQPQNTTQTPTTSYNTNINPAPTSTSRFGNVSLY